MSRALAFLEKYELSFTLLIFGIPLAVVIPLWAGITSRSLFQWLVVEAMFGGMYLFIAAVLLRQAKKKKAWQRIAVQMGLTYSKDRGVSAALFRGIFSSIQGDYRNHPVQIYLGSDENGQYTAYRVQFENAEQILMHLHKQSTIGSILSVHQDIMVNDPEFDQKYVVQGNRPLSLQAILDSSIRKKIMNTKDFHILINGERPDVACYQEKGFVSNPARLRTILDLMIEIVERVEKA